MQRRTIETSYTEEDSRIEGTLRPQRLSEYIGQSKIKESLEISIQAAKLRGEPLDHLLFYGPPGLGKTTISGIIANEMGVNMRVTSGPAIEKPGEMAAILNGLKENDILFVDEIHRLNKQVEEVLYPAMEDFAIDILIGKGAAAKSIRLDLPEIHRLEFYNTKELKQIVMASAKKLRVDIDEEGAAELARRSRGTPRLANRILKRVRDYAQVRYDGKITLEVARTALDLMDVDRLGLDRADRNFLLTLIEKFGGGPAGLDTLAAAIGEDPGTIEDLLEPYLLQNGLINRTPRGRVATQEAYAHLGIPFEQLD